MEFTIYILGIVNQNLGVVTLLAGLVAFLVYRKQKWDKKRDAASLILQEIRYAEQQIRHARERRPAEYNYSNKLLPTNSWNDNIHLFVKELKESEIDTISGFYGKASRIDYLILRRLDQETGFQPPSAPMILPPTLQGSLPSTVPQAPAPSFPFLPPPERIATIGLLDATSVSVEYIYNTPMVDKLRQIADRKWYHWILLK